jgi:F-type H+-transporting ATPase subunit b
MLDFNKYTFILAFINLLILYFILKKLLFKKVTDFMEARTQKIKNSIAEADNLKLESEKMKEEYESNLNKSLKEAVEIISDAKKRAENEAELIINSARKEADDLIEKARLEIDREKEQMISDVKNYVTELTIDAASKLMSENMNSSKNKQLVNKFIEEDGDFDGSY